MGFKMLSLVSSLFGRDSKNKDQATDPIEISSNKPNERPVQNQQIKQNNRTPRYKFPRSNIKNSPINPIQESDTSGVTQQFQNSNSSREHARTRRNSCDDKEGHYIVVEGENFTNRFVILKLLGQGTFGRVIKCFDRLNNKHVAIKVIRAINKYRDAARIEIRVLKTLENFDPKDSYGCIRLLEWFDYKNHICLVFDLLGPSVFDFLKFNEFRPFSLAQVQNFTNQLLRSVAYCHHLHMIHTDLKPENILLLSSDYTLADFGIKNSDHKNSLDGNSQKIIKTKVLKSTDVKLIDFGSTTFEDEYHSSVVSTRHYRAPEIILELGWSYPCDIWSMACVIIELLTGQVIFQTHENLEHLAMMESLLGKIPSHMVDKVNHSLKHQFFKGGILEYPNNSTSSKSLRNVRNMVPLSTLVNPEAGVIHLHLYDLLEKMLRFDPLSRITAIDALKHPFFSLNIKSSSSAKKHSLPNPGFKIEKYQFSANKNVPIHQRFASASPRLIKHFNKNLKDAAPILNVNQSNNNQTEKKDLKEEQQNVNKYDGMASNFNNHHVPFSKNNSKNDPSDSRDDQNRIQNIITDPYSGSSSGICPPVSSNSAIKSNLSHNINYEPFQHSTNNGQYQKDGLENMLNTCSISQNHQRDGQINNVNIVQTGLQMGKSLQESEFSKCSTQGSSIFVEPSYEIETEDHSHYHSNSDTNHQLPGNSNNFSTQQPQISLIDIHRTSAHEINHESSIYNSAASQPSGKSLTGINAVDYPTTLRENPTNAPGESLNLDHRMNLDSTSPFSTTTVVNSSS
ncbi:Serine/threonine-protein kinase AFC1 [Smittium mucronatum]|uniref:Serine/threonine-protein kinase AFC1 n=1 Tax=Smittium mucronatum TaxID=133383 RepID=A0A1R0H7I7_9FUNG|nr:Serine/threonine-protein kinase AFC1 [Smittium mucronatum]